MKKQKTNLWVFNLNLILGLLMLSYLASCSMIQQTTPESFISTSYKTLYTSAILYDTTMNTITNMSINEKISNENMEKIISYAQQYVQSYQLSVTCLENYKIGIGSEQTTQTQIQLFLSTLNEFVEFTATIIK